MSSTHQLTIRGVDDATKKLLSAHARKKGMSLNAYSLEILRGQVGTSKAKKTNGLERFAGTMEFDEELEAALRDQRHIGSRDQKIDRLLDNLK
jgi:plasmid stability protein